MLSLKIKLKKKKIKKKNEYLIPWEVSILFNLKKKLIRKLEVKIISVKVKKKVWSKTKKKKAKRLTVFIRFLCV